MMHFSTTGKSSVSLLSTSSITSQHPLLLLSPGLDANSIVHQLRVYGHPFRKSLFQGQTLAMSRVSFHLCPLQLVIGGLTECTGRLNQDARLLFLGELVSRGVCTV